MSEALDVPPTADGAALRFLLPGLAHSLNNALFAIQGRAQMIAAVDGDPTPNATAILSAATRARATLEVLCVLHGQPTAAQNAARWLEQLGEFLAVPLREHRLGVECLAEPDRRAARIDPRPLVVGVVEVVRRLVEALPSGFAGDIVLRLPDPAPETLTVEIAIRREPDQLPFPVDAEAVLGAAGAALTQEGIVADAGDQAAGDSLIRLLLPKS